MASHDGCRFFLTLVDDCSRMSWVYMLRMKSDVIIILRQFFALIKTQFSKSVKIFISDNGTKFSYSNCTELFTSLVLFIKAHIYTHTLAK